MNEQRLTDASADIADEDGISFVELSVRKLDRMSLDDQIKYKLKLNDYRSKQEMRVKARTDHAFEYHSRSGSIVDKNPLQFAHRRSISLSTKPTNNFESHMLENPLNMRT